VPSTKDARTGRTQILPGKDSRYAVTGNEAIFNERNALVHDSARPQKGGKSYTNIRGNHIRGEKRGTGEHGGRMMLHNYFKLGGEEVKGGKNNFDKAL